MSAQKSRLKFLALLAVLLTNLASPSLADRAALYDQNSGGTNGVYLQQR